MLTGRPFGRGPNPSAIPSGPIPKQNFCHQFARGQLSFFVGGDGPPRVSGSLARGRVGVFFFHQFFFLFPHFSKRLRSQGISPPLHTHNRIIGRGVLSRANLLQRQNGAGKQGPLPTTSKKPRSTPRGQSRTERDRQGKFGQKNPSRLIEDLVGG